MSASSQMDKPLIEATLDRAKAILAVRDAGRSMMPESPYEVLRACVDLIERLRVGLVDAVIEREELRRASRVATDESASAQSKEESE